MTHSESDYKWGLKIYVTKEIYSMVFEKTGYHQEEWYRYQPWILNC